MTSIHRNNFDCLRLFGALLVMYSHQFALVGREQPSVLPGQTVGGLGVLIFFSISGYLVMLSWTRDPHPGRFLLRRFLRIWPGLAMAVLICYVVLGPIFAPVSAAAYFSDPRYRGMLRYLWFGTGDPGVFTNHPSQGLNGSIWTIPKEVACYVALAIAGSIGVLNNRRVVPMGIGLAALVYFLWIGGETGLAWARRSIFFYPVFFAAFFVAGMALAQYAALFARLRWFIAVIALIAGMSATIAGEHAFALWLMVPVLSVWFGLASWPLLASAGRYGDFSYGLYLYAWPVQQMVIEALGIDAPVSRLLLVSFAGSALAAAISWFLIERPALSRKPTATHAVRSLADQLSVPRAPGSA